MPVSFKDFHMNDYGRPLTVENAFRFYGSFVGIHDYAFNRLYSLGDTGWKTASVTADFSGGQLEAHGPGSAWGRMFQTEVPLPADHTVYARTEGDDGYFGIIVGATDTYNYFMVVNEGDDHWKVFKYTNNVPSLVYAVDVSPVANGGEYVCSFHPYQTGSHLDDFWLAISLWRNDHLILTYTEKIGEPLIGPYFTGMAFYTTEPRSVLDFWVPELTTHAEYGTLDPGEEPAGGLRRAMEGRYVIYFLRFDGTLRAFRPTTRAVDHNLAGRELLSIDKTVDFRTLKSLIRMMGAYDSGEALDNEILAMVGHRVEVIHNPMLMSEFDCIHEAYRHLRRLRSESNTVDVDTVHLVMLELEDRLLLGNKFDGVVESYNKDYSPGAIISSMRLRKYVVGL